MGLNSKPCAQTLHFRLATLFFLSLWSCKISLLVSEKLACKEGGESKVGFAKEKTVEKLLD
tara:strand:+ start:38 stop:220 length:183 start_codon:yes stop_codon:yes gene_type:complete